MDFSALTEEWVAEANDLTFDEWYEKIEKTIEAGEKERAYWARPFAALPNQITH